MEYPRLRNMPIDALICMAKQKNDEKFTNYVEQIILEYYLRKSKSNIDLMIEYMSSSGLKRKKIGEAIAIKLVDEIFIIDMDLIKTLMSELAIEYLWMLSEKCQIALVKDMAFEEIMKHMEHYEQDELLSKELEDKIAADQLALRLERGDFNDGRN